MWQIYVLGVLIALIVALLALVASTGPANYPPAPSVPITNHPAKRVRPYPNAAPSEPGFITTYQQRHYPPFFRGEPLPWLGITYPSLLTSRPLLSFWSKFFCPRGHHLFDEVYSIEFGHSVHCDACSLSVNISPEPSLAEVLRAEGLASSSKSSSVAP